jgi:hypothetical protein
MIRMRIGTELLPPIPLGKVSRKQVRAPFREGAGRQEWG